MNWQHLGNVMGAHVNNLLFDGARVVHCSVFVFLRLIRVGVTISSTKINVIVLKTKIRRPA